METMANGNDTLYLTEEFFTTTDGMTSGDTTTTWLNTTPYYTPTYWYPYTVQEKITLKLSEVEHLRKVARRDRKLRNTLKKFAHLIEVEVDFPG